MRARAPIPRALGRRASGRATRRRPRPGSRRLGSTRQPSRSTRRRPRPTRRPVLLLVGLVALAASGCRGDDAPPPAEDAARREVLARVEAYYADFSARDWDAFAAHFWPGATLTTVWQPPEADAPRVVVTGLDAFVEQAPEGPGSREIFEETLLSADVTVRSGLAQVWARYAARFGDPGDVMEWRGIDAFTLIRHDGEWKIVSLSYTDTD